MANNIVNLIRKDFGAMWSERRMGLVFVVLLVMSAIWATYLNFASLEEKSRTERFFASLPVLRRDIVLARYGGVFIIAAIYFLMACLAGAVSNFAGKTDMQPITPGYCATVLVVLAFVTSLTFPFYFKYGLARAKAITTLLLGVFMALTIPIIANLGGGSSKVLNSFLTILHSPFPRDLFNTLLLIGIAIILWSVSIPVTVAVYSKKDL